MGHAPLVIPWHEVALIEDKKAWYGRLVHYVLGAEERVPLAIRGALADKIEAARQLNFPVG